MFNRKFSNLENKISNNSDWFIHKDQLMFEDYEGFEGEIVVHVAVHRSNKFQIYNGMYIATCEPYLMLVYHPTESDDDSKFETKRNLKQDEEDEMIIAFLKSHKLMDEEGNLQ